MHYYYSSRRALVSHLVATTAHTFDAQHAEQIYDAVGALSEPVRRGLSILGRLREERSGLKSQLAAGLDHFNDLVDGDALDGAQRRAWASRFSRGADTLAKMDQQVEQVGADLLALV